MPYGLTQILDTDLNYVRSIKAGRKIEVSEDSPAGYQFSTTAPEAGMPGMVRADTIAFGYFDG